MIFDKYSFLYYKQIGSAGNSAHAHHRTSAITYTMKIRRYSITLAVILVVGILVGRMYQIEKNNTALKEASDDMQSTNKMMMERILTQSANMDLLDKMLRRANGEHLPVAKLQVPKDSIDHALKLQTALASARAELEHYDRCRKEIRTMASDLPRSLDPSVSLEKLTPREDAVREMLILSADRISRAKMLANICQRNYDEYVATLSEENRKKLTSK